MDKAIIPCAGFGTRMGMSPDQSKELLINPKTGQPLIEFSLTRCEKAGITPHVITRPEKKDLIEYCHKRTIPCQVIIPEGEWPDTILASQGSWGDNNVLILPDTVFYPNVVALTEILNHLRYNVDYTIGVHSVSDVSLWGEVDLLKDTITEKPNSPGAGYAWGLLGFKKEVGFDLFRAMKKRNNPFHLENAEYIILRLFQDLTRDPSNKLAFI